FLHDAALDDGEVVEAAWQDDPEMMLDLYDLVLESGDDPLPALDRGLEWLVFESPVLDEAGGVRFMDVVPPALVGGVAPIVTGALAALSKNAFIGAEGGGARANTWRGARARLLGALEERRSLGG